MWNRSVVFSLLICLQTNPLLLYRDDSPNIWGKTGILMRVLLLFPPLLSGHHALNTLSLALLWKYNEGTYIAYSPRCMYSHVVGDDWLWTTNVASLMCLFQNTALFLPKIMLIYDKPLLIPPPLSDHLMVPRRWPLSGGSTAFSYVERGANFVLFDLSTSGNEGYLQQNIM